MPTEHLGSTPEHSKATETGVEAAREEQLNKAHEALKANETGEHDPAKHAERQAELAREIINREPEPPAPAENEAPPAASPRPFLDHHLNYVQTLTSLQRKLKPVSRSFSKVIHTPIVEKTSEALETTVARPSVVLGATWTALIIGTIFYLTAHHYGYALSGSELLFSFVVGALLGLLLEGLWRTLKRRH